MNREDYLAALRANVHARASALESRDKLVIEANKFGNVPVTEIAEALDLTRQQVHRILHGHYVLAHLHYPNPARIGSGPVVTVFSSEDGYPEVIENMRDSENRPVEGRWLFDGISDGPYVHYRLEE